MLITGTVEKVDIGAGVFVLKGDNGTTYELRGDRSIVKQTGKHVEIAGDVDGNAVSAGMVGPILKVNTFKVL